MCSLLSHIKGPTLFSQASVTITPFEQDGITISPMFYVTVLLYEHKAGSAQAERALGQA